MEVNTTYNENEFFGQMEHLYGLIITRKRSVFNVIDNSTGDITSYNKDNFINLLENKGLYVSINGGLFKSYKYTINNINEIIVNSNPATPASDPSVNSPPIVPREEFTVPEIKHNPNIQDTGFTVKSQDNLFFDYSEYNPLNLDEDSLIAREICIQSSKIDKGSRIPTINMGRKSLRIMYGYSNDYITVYGDKKKNIYYLAFRGTKISDIEDLKTDLDLLINGITSLPEGSQSEGSQPVKILNYRIYEGILITVNLIRKVKKCKIIYTGHSLGGIIAFILMKYSKGSEGIKKPWTTKIDGEEKSWIYIKSQKEKIYDIKDKIFKTDFKCITFNTATPSTTNILYESINCSKNKHWWCSETIHHIIIGDEIPANLYKELDKIPNNYIKLYITGSINEKIKRHKIKNFRCKFSDGSVSKPCTGLIPNSKISGGANKRKTRRANKTRCSSKTRRVNKTSRANKKRRANKTRRANKNK